jgi:SWI/SNF related-matrix-associated actin-dependent regulator of chromatin subfamily C
LELKLKQFAEVETFLMKECEQVEKTRQRIAAERARLISARCGPAGVTSPMGVPGAGPSMVNNNASNRQQIVSAPPSQPSIPGYGNNQTVHPHMPFYATAANVWVGAKAAHGSNTTVLSCLKCHVQCLK